MDYVLVTSSNLLLLLLCFIASFFELIHSIQRQDGIQPKSNGEKCSVINFKEMEKFDMTKFSGKWYEAYEVMSGIPITESGSWRFRLKGNGIYQFHFTGENKLGQCLTPISGTAEVYPEDSGNFELKYKAVLSSIIESIKIIYTDYTNVAVIYSCHHITDLGTCHPAGIYAAIWTRENNFDQTLVQSALKMFEEICVNPQTLKKRKKATCDLDMWEYTPNGYPVPDVCVSEPDIGSCYKYEERFYYNTKATLCEPFVYGGCKGNKNNFKTLQECEKKCTIGVPVVNCTRTSVCALTCPSCCQVGHDNCIHCNCEKIVVDVFHTCITEPPECPVQCVAQELYDGCQICNCGNDKNEECLAPSKTGPCRASIPRYHYNIKTGECEEFTYGGCDGNKNNHENKQECEKKCKGFFKLENDKNCNKASISAVPHLAAWIILFILLKIL